MKAVIILANCGELNQGFLKDSFIVGADRGALVAIENGIVPDISIGDFDSVTKEEYERIEKNSRHVIQLNPVKDKTDTAEAVELCQGYAPIYILGGIQGHRIEHLFANVIELYQNKDLILMDEYSKIETREADFIPDTEYTYLSLFSLASESVISLEGMKYNLDHYVLRRNDPLGVSNEMMEAPRVHIHSGRLLVIHTVSDHEKL